MRETCQAPLYTQLSVGRMGIKKKRKSPGNWYNWDRWPAALSTHRESISSRQALTQSQIKVDINVPCWPPETPPYWEPLRPVSPDLFSCNSPYTHPTNHFWPIIFSPRLNFLECHFQHVYTAKNHLKDHCLLLDKVQAPQPGSKKLFITWLLLPPPASPQFPCLHTSCTHFLVSDMLSTHLSLCFAPQRQSPLSYLLTDFFSSFKRGFIYHLQYDTFSHPSR